MAVAVRRRSALRRYDISPSVTLYGRADDSSPRCAVFGAFCYYEAAINQVTNDKLDPVAKIPELKYCAVRVTKGGDAPKQVSFGGGQAIAAIAANS